MERARDCQGQEGHLGAAKAHSQRKALVRGCAHSEPTSAHALAIPLGTLVDTTTRTPLGSCVIAPAPLPSTVHIHGIPHDTGVVRDDNERPDVLRLDPKFLLPTPLQLQVVIGQLLDQEVGGSCNRQLPHSDPLHTHLHPTRSPVHLLNRAAAQAKPGPSVLPLASNQEETHVPHFASVLFSNSRYF